MAKDPAFLFYTGDFTTGTQFFSDEQVGKFLRLLMAQHQHGHLTEQQMIFICKSYDKEVFSKFQKDSDGLFYNVRLEFEVNKRRSFSESRSKNKSGKTKIISKSYDNHMENENENKIKKENTNNKDIDSRILIFKKTLTPFFQTYETEMLKNFFEYWTEKTPNGKKFRQEMQKTWDIKRRLHKWSLNNFDKPKIAPDEFWKEELKADKVWIESFKPQIKNLDYVLSEFNRKLIKDQKQNTRTRSEYASYFSNWYETEHKKRNN